MGETFKYFMDLTIPCRYFTYQVLVHLFEMSVTHVHVLSGSSQSHYVTLSTRVGQRYLYLIKLVSYLFNTGTSLSNKLSVKPLFY